jgi:hypothetical protein
VLLPAFFIFLSYAATAIILPFYTGAKLPMEREEVAERATKKIERFLFPAFFPGGSFFPVQSPLPDDEDAK